MFLATSPFPVRRVKNLYYLDNVTPNATAEVLTKVHTMNVTKITLDLMHQRLGHLNMRAVKQLFKKDMVRGATLSAKHLKSTPPSANGVSEAKCNALHFRSLRLVILKS